MTASLDIAIIVLVFALIYAITDRENFVLKYLSKYVFVLGFVIVCFQLMADYTNLAVLQLLFFFSIVIFVLCLIFDILLMIPMLFDIIMVAAGKRRRRET